VCPRSLIEAYEHDHGVRLRHGWGMTEMSPFGALAGRWSGGDEATWDLRVSQGRLLGSVQARVVGPDGSVLPNDGEHMGEVEVRGPWVTGGYFGQSGPRPGAGGWLPTGDIATISPNRVVRLKDRSKDVIKSGGEWIVSLDLERNLEQHPDVVDVAVIGVPDERWGERPLAVVTSAGALDFAELAGFLAGRIDRWQVPERWAQVAALPRTTVGKTDKQAIRERYANGGLTVIAGSPPRSEADSRTAVRP
jgi:fatty-acyl-CoA synthase